MGSVKWPGDGSPTAWEGERKGEELGLGDGVRKDSGSGEFTVSGREDTPGRSPEAALEALTVYFALCVLRL